MQQWRPNGIPSHGINQLGSIPSGVGVGSIAGMGPISMAAQSTSQSPPLLPLEMQGSKIEQVSRIPPQQLQYYMQMRQRNMMMPGAPPVLPVPSSPNLTTGSMPTHFPSPLHLPNLQQNMPVMTMEQLDDGVLYKPKKAKSDVWEFFRLSQNDKFRGKAKCLLCGHWLVYSSGTSSLAYHLNSQHQFNKKKRKSPESPPGSGATAGSDCMPPLPALPHPPHNKLRNQATSGGNEVAEWLEQLGLGQYGQVFMKEGFDRLDRVEAVEVVDLTDMGMRRGHIRTIMQALKARAQSRKMGAAASAAALAASVSSSSSSSSNPPSSLNNNSNSSGSSSSSSSSSSPSSAASSTAAANAVALAGLSPFSAASASCPPALCSGHSFSVCNFGAVGDGCTNDYDAIMNAIHAAQIHSQSTGSVAKVAKEVKDGKQSGGVGVGGVGSSGIGIGCPPGSYAVAIVWFPPGIYVVSNPIVIEQNGVMLCGAGEKVTKIRRSARHPMNFLVRIGRETASGDTCDSGISNMSLDGNGGCNSAVLRLRNTINSQFTNLEITNGLCDGLRSETIDCAHAHRSQFAHITSRDNGGVGFHFLGERESVLSDLHAMHNGKEGFLFRGFVLINGKNVNSHTSQACIVNSAVARDNKSSGCSVDGADKLIIHALSTVDNGGFGLEIKNAAEIIQIQNGASGSEPVEGAVAQARSMVMVNSFEILSFTSHNDRRGCIYQVRNSRLENCYFGRVSCTGGSNVEPTACGVQIHGAKNITFQSLTMQDMPSTCVKICAGDPSPPSSLSGSSPSSSSSSSSSSTSSSGTSSFEPRQCERIFLHHVNLYNNGERNQGEAHGVCVLNKSSVYFGNLFCSNEQTYNANYELLVSDTAKCVVSGLLSLTSKNLTNGVAILSERLGNHTLSPPRPGEGCLVLGSQACFMDGDQPCLVLGEVATGTTPRPAQSQAKLYVDSDSLQLLFSDGTKRTIAQK